jgi:predicted deacylase
MQIRHLFITQLLMLSIHVCCLVACTQIEFDLASITRSNSSIATFTVPSPAELPQSIFTATSPSKPVPTLLVTVIALPTGDVLPQNNPEATTALPTQTPTHEALPSFYLATIPESTVSAIISHIGNSVSGRPIYSYRLGSGTIDIVIVGGIHGGYEWNTVVLAEEFLSYFQVREADIPPAITLHIVPNANPDGLAVVSGADGILPPTEVLSNTLVGRFNANGVDLNRNWDCLWTAQALWRDQTVSAGTHPFSEPETENLRRFFLEIDPALVIFLHSAADAVYVSGCPEPDPASAEMAAIYGLAANYPVYPTFDHYIITGDAGDWLTTQSIPSFTVELSSHETTDWDRNLEGLMAILVNYLEERNSRGAE